jgi:HEAT repeat protein
MSEFDFKLYLSAIATLYSKDGNLYTPTDALLLPLEVRSVAREEQEGREKKVEQWPVLEGLRRYAIGEEQEHVLLVGRPGSGKSTALRQFAVELAEAALLSQPLISEDIGEQEEMDLNPLPLGRRIWGEIPVLIQLKGDRSILELIKAEVQSRARVRITDDQIEDWLWTNRLVLLMDGGNEIPREQLRNNLIEFRNQNLKTPIVITTREFSTDNLGIKVQVEMKPLSSAQIRLFVENHLGKKQADLLLNQLSDQLSEIAETPLLLKILCDISRQTKEIPQNKGELFRLFDSEYEKLKKDVDYIPVSENFWDFKSEILQYLAFTMIQADEQRPSELWSTISVGRAEKILETWLSKRGMLDSPLKAKKWLKDLRRCHLLQDAVTPGEVEFHHQLFQEYYAAEVLLNMFEEPNISIIAFSQFKFLYLNHAKWTQAIEILLSLLRNKVAVMEIVKSALELDLDFGARLAGKARGEFQDETIELISLLKVPEWYKIQLLSKTKSQSSIPFLLDALRSENFNSYWYASCAFRDIKSNKAFSSLILMLQDPIAVVRRNAIYALEYLGFEAAIPSLIEALRDTDSSVRWRAASALRQYKSQAVIPALLTVIADPNSMVRKEVVEALGEFSSEQGIFYLLRALEDSDIWVRVKSADSLAKIASEDSIAGLLKAVQDSSGDVRKLAAKALVAIGQRAPEKVLSELALIPLATMHGEVISAKSQIQANCKFYNYEIFHSPPANSQPEQHLPPPPSNINYYNGDHIEGDKIQRDKISGNKIEYTSPNATEVKIFEQVDNYNHNPPDPPQNPAS